MDDIKEVKFRKKKIELENTVLNKSRRIVENENLSKRNVTTANRQKSYNFVSGGSYIFTFVLVITALLIYDLRCLSKNTINLQMVKTDLLNNVYGQNDSIYVILNSLTQLFSHEQNLHVVNFIGSTGVGKTFIASILKHHFYSIYELNGPLNSNFQQTIINNLQYASFNYYHLVIVEDLTKSDVENVLLFIKNIPQDLVVFVVCIFNIQETDNELSHYINYSNVDKISEAFNEAQIPHKVAKFHEFGKDQVREWVTKQLNEKGIALNYHSRIVESILDGQDIRYQGLKGLSSKINLEL